MDLNSNNQPPSSKSNPSISISQFSLEKHIYSTLFKKHHINDLIYNTNVINDIIYNEKTHTVATFKDFLILDDLSEFLKRYYTTVESIIRLPRFLEYYETYSRIFPNYTSFPESKYIYKNIHRKQKMIDQQQNIERTERRGNDNKYENQVFSTEVCNSIANDSSYMKYLFGLKGNGSQYKRNNDNNNEVNINISSKVSNTIVDESIQCINKLITLLETCEHNRDKICKLKHNANITTSKQKRPTLIINHKHTFLSSCNNHPHINKSTSNQKPYKEKHINLSHRGSFFSSSYSQRKNPNSHNSSKHKNPLNTNITNNPISNKTLHKISKDFDKIRLNINYNTPYFLNNMNSHLKSPGTDRFKHKIKDILIKNLHLNNNSHHHRNHNCLLTSKGQIFNSNTNNNSISNNTISTIQYTNAHKQTVITKSSRNTKRNNDNNVNMSEYDVMNKRNKKINVNSKSLFDYKMFRRFISSSQSKSKSKQKNKADGRKGKQRIKSNYNVDKDILSHQNRCKIKSGIISNMCSPLHKVNCRIPGIQIKGFSSLMQYPGRNKCDNVISNKNGVSLHTLKTEHINNSGHVKYRTYHTSISRTSKVNKIKYKI